jgi:PAS domain-containing protein
MSALSSLCSKAARALGALDLRTVKRLGTDTGGDPSTTVGELETALRRIRFLEAVIEQVSAPLLVRDVNSDRCVLINTVAAELAGRDREAFLEKPVDEIYPPWRAAEIRNNDREMRRTRTPLISVEHTIDSPQGPRRIIAKRGAAL